VKKEREGLPERCDRERWRTAALAPSIANSAPSKEEPKKTKQPRRKVNIEGQLFNSGAARERTQLRTTRNAHTKGERRAEGFGPRPHGRRKAADNTAAREKKVN